MVADGTGVVVLPAARAQVILENAERYYADDNAAIKDLNDGLAFSEEMAKYTRI